MESSSASEFPVFLCLHRPWDLDNTVSLRMLAEEFELTFVKQRLGEYFLNGHTMLFAPCGSNPGSRQ